MIRGEAMEKGGQHRGDVCDLVDLYKDDLVYIWIDSREEEGLLIE